MSEADEQTKHNMKSLRVDTLVLRPVVLTEPVGHKHSITSEAEVCLFELFCEEAKACTSFSLFSSLGLPSSTHIGTSGGLEGGSCVGNNHRWWPGLGRLHSEP